LSAKWIFLITISIFGSAFLGIFLSTIIFDGPSPDSAKPFENESLEKSTIPKTPTESTVEEEPEPTPIEPSVEEEPKAQDSTPTELEGKVTPSSSTGVQ